MFTRFAIALILGALLGTERELVGKEAGVRTEMLVAAGAAIFTIVGISLPYLISSETGNLTNVIAGNSGFLTLIGNIVVGVGFLGAGLIIHTGDRAHGLTTAALVWTTAAIGILVGLGLYAFAVTTSIVIIVLLYIFRKLNISEKFEEHTEPLRR